MTKVEIFDNSGTQWMDDAFRLTETTDISVAVVGIGYVGLVSTACFSALGHTVVSVDSDALKVASVQQGKSPIHEARVSEMLNHGVDKGLISATRDITDAVISSDVTFLAVGTPTGPDGECDLDQIRSAATSIGQALAETDGFHVVAIRSSVPPGTTANVVTPILEAQSGKIAGLDFGVVFNPEFLREGSAVDDFFSPPKTVIAASDSKSAQIVSNLFAQVDPNPVITTIETAEMVKYADNLWHATKVCFANEIGRLCKTCDVDSHAVMDVFVKDTKLNISAAYLNPGFAFGGSCLPKEVRAISGIGRANGVALPLVDSLLTSNAAHIDAAAKLIGDTGAKRIGILGLAFKPGTDDLRESPVLPLIARLRAAGHSIVAHDPVIDRTSDLATFSDPAGLDPTLQSFTRDELREMIRESAQAILSDCDVLVVTQNQPQYRNLVLAAHPRPVVDLVRMFTNPPKGCGYHGIGW